MHGLPGKQLHGADLGTWNRIFQVHPHLVTVAKLDPPEQADPLVTRHAGIFSDGVQCFSVDSG
jgi:hypothetical protein